MSRTGRNMQRLAEYVRKNPDDSFSKFALALELLKNNQEQKALVLFESIRRLDPDYLGTYYHLGSLYRDLGQTDDAEHCFRQGMQLAAAKNEQRTLSELTEALEQLREEKNHE